MRILLLGLVGLVCLGAVLVSADTSEATGKLVGTVTDKPSGDPVIGASVQIEGTSLGAMTGFDGKFTITQVRPGTYTLKVSHTGYKDARIEGVVARAGEETECSFALVKSASSLDTKTAVSGAPDVLQYADGIMPEAARDEKKYSPAVNELTRRQWPTSQASSECDQQFPFAHGGNAIVNDEPFDAMFFNNYGVNPFVDTEDDHLSTFAIDVDDASFVMARAYLERGSLPPNEAIRTEEFINRFRYDYAAPTHETFGIFVEGAPSQFGQNAHLVRIGIKGYEVDPARRKPANLVFVVDISGSMGREDRLGLVRQSLRMLVDQLAPRDRVGIVVYGSSGEIRLRPTSIDGRRAILDAIESLQPSGATNAEEGIRLGYEMAARMYEPGKINRVILCSDGVANVGRTGPDQILEIIRKYADQGITLSAVGFGMGNYNDILMEKLGNKGNGSYAYVDDWDEARRVFVDNLTGNLQVIARDVKIQVDFNPDVVRSYRLIGYENRDVADDRFRDDTEDGGEIGAGHQVTALYEVKFHQPTRRGTLGAVYIRWKDADYAEEVSEVRAPIRAADLNSSFSATSHDFRLAAAAAEFGEILRKSYWARESSLESVLELCRRLEREKGSREVDELIRMVSVAGDYTEELAHHQ